MGSHLLGLGDAPLPNANSKSKKGSHTIHVGTVHLSRMKSFRPAKVKEIPEKALSNAEAAEAARREGDIPRSLTNLHETSRIGRMPCRHIWSLSTSGVPDLVLC